MLNYVTTYCGIIEEYLMIWTLKPHGSQIHIKPVGRCLETSFISIKLHLSGFNIRSHVRTSAKVKKIGQAMYRQIMNEWL